MDESLKQRLIGAAVLIGLGVIFIPMFLGDPDPELFLEGSPVPARPEGAAADAKTYSLDSEYFTNLEEAAPPSAEPVKEKTTPPLEKPADPAVALERPKDPLAETLKPPSVAESQAPPPAQERVGVTAWAIQLGSFTSEENAKLLETKLRQRGYHAFVDKIYVKDAKVFRVRVGPELLESKAKQLQARIEQEVNLKGLVVRYP